MSATSILLALSLFSCKDDGGDLGVPLDTDTGSATSIDADGDGFSAEED